MNRPNRSELAVALFALLLAGVVIAFTIAALVVSCAPVGD